MVNPETRTVRWATYVASVLAAPLWELAGAAPTRRWPPPLSATLQRLWEMVETGELRASLGGSLALFVAGFGIALFTALPSALALAHARPARRTLRLHPARQRHAMVALIPSSSPSSGSSSAQGAGVFLFCFFPILYNTIEGATPSGRADRSGALVPLGRMAIWRDVMLPGTFPYAMRACASHRARPGGGGRRRILLERERHRQLLMTRAELRYGGLLAPCW